MTICVTKISIETKIIAVEAYLTGTDSKAAVRNRYHIARQLFSVLVAIYEEYGRQGLLNPPKVTDKFRVDLVK
ncbi:hypothetical protein OKN36_22140 [Furfurilactobacillus sp. OKN36]